MIKRLKTTLENAQSQRRKLTDLGGEQNSFAHRLAAQSITSHIEEIEQQIALLDTKPVMEQIEFRLISEDLNNGSIPLGFLSKTTNEIRQMIGFAALQILEGERATKRVSDFIYSMLDLRLVTVLKGSTRLLITAASDRDLFNESLSKNILERIFDVLETGGQGEQFMLSVVSLGTEGSRHLRSLLQIVKGNAAQLELSWRYSGDIVRKWNGNDQVLSEIVIALENTIPILQQEFSVSGVIDLLSKNERIHLISNEGTKIRILYPKKLLDQVATLHLDQYVTFRCLVTEMQNPSTKENSLSYELLEVIK
jgi:hypothetical protein